jgi:hypothetical protein
MKIEATEMVRARVSITRCREVISSGLISRLRLGPITTVVMP